MTGEAHKESKNKSKSKTLIGRSADKGGGRASKHIGKIDRMKTLLASGIPADFVASILGIEGEIVRSYADRSKNHDKKSNEFGSSAEYVDYLEDKKYKDRMEHIQEIVQILTSWDDVAVSKLADDLRSGKLTEKYTPKDKSAEIEESTVKYTQPPNGEMYAARPNRKETAPAFIERVYGGAGWLNGEFTRADLRKLDPAATMGLANWEKNHRKRAPLNLPTKEQANDRLLASGAPIETSDPRETARRRAAAWRRQQQPL